MTVLLIGLDFVRNYLLKKELGLAENGVGRTVFKLGKLADWDEHVIVSGVYNYIACLCAILLNVFITAYMCGSCVV